MLKVISSPHCAVFGSVFIILFCFEFVDTLHVGNSIHEVCECARNANELAWVVQRVDNTIHCKNHYPVDSVVCFIETYPLDSDLSGG